jgi:mRNA interferase MazF
MSKWAIVPICLSHRLVSDYANIAIFAPISNTTRRYPLYVPLKETKTQGTILLDQLVAIDYNARKFNYVESGGTGFLQELLDMTVLVFQNNHGG